MPRYFINTSDCLDVSDEVGTELPNLDALRDLLRRTLTAILRDDGAASGVNAFVARAYDAEGRLVMQAQANFSVTDL
jgi:hypothetical protein